MKFLGYARDSGSIGVRNHLLILSTVVCANHAAEKIAEKVKGAVAFCHSNGCGQLREDLEQTYRTLLGAGINSNVAAVLVVSMGCESLPSAKLFEEIRSAKKPVGFVDIQVSGGTERAVEKGSTIALELARRITEDRTEADVSNLIVAVRCGGSDATSGLAANPVVGYVADVIMRSGGTVIMSGTSEFIGSEQLLRERAQTEEVACRLHGIIDDVKQRALSMDQTIIDAQPGAGNKRGGISTIEEKSLGCISLGGTTSIVEVVRYGEAPHKNGLVIMDTPGVGVESNTAVQGGGAHIIFFTTGCGSSIGAPIAPVIKLTGNPVTYDGMPNTIDFNASAVLTGDQTREEAGEALLEELLRVASGKRTKAELAGHRETVITRIGPSI